MAVSKNCTSLSSTELQSEIRVDEKGHVTFDGTGSSLPDSEADHSPQWRFRARVWKRLDRAQHDVDMDYYRKQQLAKKEVQQDVEFMEREKAKTGSYPERPSE
jgi:hypothetical protein|tara:strand:+ start:147 stop:455 length:309 start_codon:yes stop_codon:yes gene_type:complete